MASIDKQGKIRFRDLDKKQRVLCLGDTSEHVLQEAKAHLEHLLSAQKANTPPEPVTTQWLSKIDDDLHQKLAKLGLAESRRRKAEQTMRLVDWIDTYIAERRDVKGATIETYQKAKDSLLAYFDTKTQLKQITPADAKRWRIWMLTEGNRRNKKDKSMSEETVRRRTGKVKQFFREAIERGYCESNPFEKLPSTSRGNEAKQFFVDQHVIDACIEHSPCGDWRAILALCRYGGLRCPSELLELRWQDVNLPEGRMIIHAAKTEHHTSGGVRVCPKFVELRPHLESAWDEAT